MTDIAVPASAPLAAAPPPTAAAAVAPIEMRNIVQEYPQPDGKTLRVLDDISLRIDRPGINMLLGPSGCGKSTLMKMLGGVRPWNVKTPTAGEVLIDGKRCDSHHEDTIMVFQQYNNRPDMTVRDNVAYPFRFKEWSRRVDSGEAGKRVEDMIGAVGLADKRDLYPSQLSGGQNQRVALARALVTRPKILLMDEPFGALDAQTRLDMQGLLIRLHRAQPCVIVFVTHDVSEALILGDRVIVLSSQPARVIDDFAIHEPQPRSVQWLGRPDVRALDERVVAHLRQSSVRGQVRVGV